MILSINPAPAARLYQRPMLHAVSRITNLDAIYGDPFLDRMITLSQISLEERLNWIVWARSVLEARKSELAGEFSATRGRYDDMLKEANISLIDVRLSWLDRLYEQVSAEISSDAKHRAKNPADL